MSIRSQRTKFDAMQPLDRAAWAVMGLLAVMIAAMLLLGSQALPSVRNFSWQDQAVSAEDVAFMLTFTQPVEPQSVEQNLVIEPALAGKFSWAGRRMAYTLAVPAPYGESYTLSLAKANALSGRSGFEPFQADFRTRDRIFAYIGAEGADQGRLIMFNLTRKKKTILTPEGQRVLNFKPYPERDRILFSAIDTTKKTEGLAIASLYTVSTGLDETAAPAKWKFWQQATKPLAAGTTQLVLDNKNYQNLKFDLSADGQIVVVQRVSNQNPADFGPWVIRAGEAPRPLKTEPGGDFTIAPDSQSLLLQQGQGTAVIALVPDAAPAAEPTAQASEALLDFLPEYGLTLDVASDGSAAALVNFNQDDPAKQYTQSLFWVSSAGVEKQLLETNGSILSAQFSDNNQLLYCLVNRLVEGPGLSANAAQTSSPDTEPNSEEGIATDSAGAAEPENSGSSELDLGDQPYQVVPYLSVINVKTGQEQKLLEMPPQPEITMSPSPDGIAILFDETLVLDSQSSGSSFSGATDRLWLLPLFSTEAERMNEQPIPLPPAQLEVAGRHPIWLP